jgi:putative DNA primase/helicase
MLTVADLFCGEKKGRHPIIATYDYVDEHGTLLFQACRLSNKRFFQRQPVAGGWEDHIKGVRRVLYHLPEVLAAIPTGTPIYIAEGEKDVDAIRSLGLTATCNPMGAGKWNDPGYADALHGADCYLLPDHDTPGAEHMEHVARQLAPVAHSVHIVPGIHTQASKSDVSDWLGAGHTRAELEAAAQAAPRWTPSPLAFHAAAPAPSNGTHPPAPQAPPTHFDADRLYTDTYNARALVRDHGANLRYCYPWKAWMVWTGTHWQRDTSGVVMRLAKQTIKAMARLLPSLDDKQAFALLAHIKASLTTAKLKAMLENAQSEEGMAVQPDEFDRDLFLLNVANGTIDLRTGTLRETTRSDLLTKCLPIAYDPTATCARWETFLTRAMGGKQGLIAFLHRAVGYSLTGSTIEQCLFILHGPTKTGKTTFLARLRSLLGPYGTQADMESFMHKDRPEVRNDLADLAGRRVVCAVESQEGRRLNESLIKQLTGGVDQVKARFLFEEYFTYTPQYKIFIGTNHKPVIKDTNQAIWERIRLVPFIVQIPPKERDKKLDEVLQAELPGILAWAVRGCLDWQQRGDLEPPPEVLTATKAWQDESDVLGRFLAERCVILRQAQVRAQPLWDAYKTWCETNGETWEKQTAFGIKLGERGFDKKQSHGIVYMGLGLRSDDQD